MATYTTIALCVFGLFVLIVIYIASLSAPKEISLLNRLPNTESENLRLGLDKKPTTAYGKFHQKYFANKMLNGGLEKYARLVGVDIAKLEQKIFAARLEEKISVEEVISLKLVGYVGGVSLGIIGFLGRHTTIGMMVFVLAVGIYYLCCMYPQKMVDSTFKKRQGEILMTLPGFIELVYSTLEAGSTIQEALQMIAERTTGVLSQEFLAVTARTKISGRWKSEMEVMAENCGVEQLSDLVSDILISYEKGTSVVQVLKDDSEQLRAIKNAKLQEKAKKLTVTLLIPMAIFCFLPMFGLMLGPMAVQFLENF